MQDLRFVIPERPTTLPRKGSKADRRVPNGLSSGHSVDKPGYLVSVDSTSSAFDNPYYLDLVAKAASGAAAVDGPSALESDRGVSRHVNGFMTPTAENPEYLGLVDTWTGHSWGTEIGSKNCILLRKTIEREDEHLSARGCWCWTEKHRSLNPSEPFIITTQHGVALMGSLWHHISCHSSTTHDFLVPKKMDSVFVNNLISEGVHDSEKLTTAGYESNALDWWALTFPSCSSVIWSSCFFPQLLQTKKNTLTKCTMICIENHV